MENTNTDRKKVFFVLPSLAAGGAERVMSFIAQNIDQNKFDSSLIVTGFENQTVYEIKEVKVVYLNKKRVLHAIPSLFSYIRKNKPKVVISAIGELNIVTSIFSIILRKVKFVGREVNVVGTLDVVINGKKTKQSFLGWLSFKLLDKVICQSNDMAEDLISNYRLKKSKVVIINNPITDSFNIVKSNTKKSQITEFITVGSLEKRKGHKRLLGILSKLTIPYHYTIIGDGSLREDILAQAEELGITKNISHIPYTSNVSEYLLKSDVFLLGSYVEGFPNALIESLSVGVPAITFNIPGGINEIIQNDVNGYIANNTSEYIHYLNSNRCWDSKIVSNSVRSKYGKEFIIKKYEALIENL